MYQNLSLVSAFVNKHGVFVLAVVTEYVILGKTIPMYSSDFLGAISSNISFMDGICINPTLIQKNKSRMSRKA